MEKEPYKVLGLKISNLRNIEIVEIDFKNKQFLEVGGDNGSGKTTLIDGIFGAIIGRKYFGGTEAWRVISKGENKCMMRVTLGNKERTVEVRRSITKREQPDGTMATGGSLSIRDAEGNRLDTDFLHNMLSEFTVNPTSFARLPAKEQMEIIRDLGGVDTERYDESYTQVFEERRFANRELKELQAVTARLGSPPKVDPVDVGKLVQERREIEAFNAEQRNRQVEIAHLNEEILERKGRIQDIDRQIAELKEERAAVEKNIEEIEDEVTSLPEPEKEKSLDIIDQQMEQAAETNRKADLWRQFHQSSGRLATKQKEADGLTAKLDQIKHEKQEAILASKLPFKNLAFDPAAGVLIDDIPFSQKSRAEQIRISTRIGMEMTPDLRVLFLEEGTMLDEESYAVIRELAERHGYQILVERVGEREGADCIVMRAGKIVSAFEDKPTVGERVRKADELL